jgi:hypothetical protein
MFISWLVDVVVPTVSYGSGNEWLRFLAAMVSVGATSMTLATVEFPAEPYRLDERTS